MGKHLRKAQRRLADRLVAYDEAVKRDTRNGRGMRRPGSMSRRKSMPKGRR